MSEKRERSRRPDDEAGQVDAGALAAAPVAELTVAGELFTVRWDTADRHEVTWTTGRNPGYGFSIGVAPTPERAAVGLSADERSFVHARVVEFLAMIEPAIGFISKHHVPRPSQTNSIAPG